MTTPTRQDVMEYALEDPVIASAMMYVKDGTLSFEDAVMTALAMQTETKKLVIRDFTDHLMRCTMSHNEQLSKPKTCKVCGETLVSSICHMCDGEGTIDDTATDPLEGDEFSLCPECHGAGLYLDCPNAPHEATALDKVISICDVDGLLLKADTELRRKVCQDARAELALLQARVKAQEATSKAYVAMVQTVADQANALNEIVNLGKDSHVAFDGERWREMWKVACTCIESWRKDHAPISAVQDETP